MPAAKLFLAADHKQAIFMLTNSGKHAMPIALLLPSLVRCLPLFMYRTSAESVLRDSHRSAVSVLCAVRLRIKAMNTDTF